MKICELHIQNGQDRSDLIAILATAGYRVSVDVRQDKTEWPREINHYYVVVEDKQEAHHD